MSILIIEHYESNLTALLCKNMLISSGNVFMVGHARKKSFCPSVKLVNSSFNLNSIFKLSSSGLKTFLEPYILILILSELKILRLVFEKTFFFIGIQQWGESCTIPEVTDHVSWLTGNRIIYATCDGVTSVTQEWDQTPRVSHVWPAPQPPWAAHLRLPGGGQYKSGTQWWFEQQLCVHKWTLNVWRSQQ